MDPKQKFYRHFQDSVAELQEQIDELEAVSAVAGERQEAIDHVLAGISKLQHEVSDAAEFTPSYDRKQYSDNIKSLSDKLNETVARVTPRSRFQFKRSSIGAHVDMGAPENDPRLHPGSLSRNTQSSSGEKQQEARESDDTVGDLPSVAAIRDYNAELSQPSTQFVRKPSFSMARNIGIANQSHLHIILPSSAARATASGSLTDLKWCIVDMSVPTAQGKPFPGLALRNISNSLIVAGHVNGPVHITGVADSIIVVTARQVRIHECKNVDIYLHCTSHPIIEDCTGMRFAQLPKCYSIEGEPSKENQWDQVDDFKWLKAGQSPNWTTLSDAEALDEALWTNVVPGQPGVSVEETLKKVGIPRQ
ncbi:Tubulin binding cofactor C [Metarhizium guizhouense ARSEF 977]|uniref:Tubulin binding cofactor C n=1 Tax=Metarhizium guizhouense (strain ARSEF 977) TaxID=1276136 RepID=A0A0B4I5Y4_METGA|nr:Tubulin binding cofactor C [Metarhizium guizhouense ARSEF 977]